MADRHHLLAVFAHPDDETFSCGGIFATLADASIPVTLVCATRGEVGGISDPALATRETLAEVREAELRTAMRHVGVEDVRFLGYRDSGMVGTPENDDPRAFINAPEPDVAAQIAALLREIEPTIVITFGPDGIYGHPDHLMAHRTTTAAVELLDDDGPALYYNCISRERVKLMAQRETGPFSKMTPEELDRLGTPEDEITTLIDISKQLDRKFAAMAAHLTQFGPDGPWQDMPVETAREMMATERFRIVRPGKNRTSSDPLSALVNGS